MKIKIMLSLQIFKNMKHKTELFQICASVFLRLTSSDRLRPEGDGDWTGAVELFGEKPFS